MENNKKLQRDTQHKVIGGVCSGLANYLGLDASLVRLFFAIAFFIFSTGFWVYIILWIVMPEGNNNLYNNNNSNNFYNSNNNYNKV